ncbi:MAG TPA: hypothetical protein VK738_17890 [Terriglobales bacterium]|jgi:hypothetical protein|nr:hypothetical protein [Terriglobales bacterium]
MEQLSVDIAAQIQWSNWSHCESSFNLVLVPHHPGVYALAEEVAAEAEGSGKRKLAIFAIQETGNLAYATSSLFALGNPVGEHMVHSRCYVRYAVIQDAEQRHAVHAALQTWLEHKAENTKSSTQSPVLSTQLKPDVRPRSDDKSRGGYQNKSAPRI